LMIDRGKALLQHGLNDHDACLRENGLPSNCN
jgi:hypothetical protein